MDNVAPSLQHLSLALDEQCQVKADLKDRNFSGIIQYLRETLNYRLVFEQLTSFFFEFMSMEGHCKLFPDSEYLTSLLAFRNQLIAEWCSYANGAEELNPNRLDTSVKDRIEASIVVDPTCEKREFVGGQFIVGDLETAVKLAKVKGGLIFVKNGEYECGRDGSFLEIDHSGSESSTRIVGESTHGCRLNGRIRVASNINNYVKFKSMTFCFSYYEEEDDTPYMDDYIHVLKGAVIMDSCIIECLANTAIYVQGSQRGFPTSLELIQCHFEGFLSCQRAIGYDNGGHVRIVMCHCKFYRVLCLLSSKEVSLQGLLRLEMVNCNATDIQTGIYLPHQNQIEAHSYITIAHCTFGMAHTDPQFPSVLIKMHGSADTVKILNSRVVFTHVDGSPLILNRANIVQVLGCDFCVAASYAEGNACFRDPSPIQEEEKKERRRKGRRKNSTPLREPELDRRMSTNRAIELTQVAQTWIRATAITGFRMGVMMHGCPILHMTHWNRISECSVGCLLFWTHAHLRTQWNVMATKFTSCFQGVVTDGPSCDVVLVDLHFKDILQPFCRLLTKTCRMTISRCTEECEYKEKGEELKLVLATKRNLPFQVCWEDKTLTSMPIVETREGLEMHCSHLNCRGSGHHHCTSMDPTAAMDYARGPLLVFEADYNKQLEAAMLNNQQMKSEEDAVCQSAREEHESEGGVTDTPSESLECQPVKQSPIVSQPKGEHEAGQSESAPLNRLSEHGEASVNQVEEPEALQPTTTSQAPLTQKTIAEHQSEESSPVKFEPANGMFAETASPSVESAKKSRGAVDPKISSAQQISSLAKDFEEISIQPEASSAGQISEESTHTNHHRTDAISSPELTISEAQSSEKATSSNQRVQGEVLQEKQTHEKSSVASPSSATRPNEQQKPPLAQNSEDINSGDPVPELIVSPRDQTSENFRKADCDASINSGIESPEKSQHENHDNDEVGPLSQTPSPRSEKSKDPKTENSMDKKEAENMADEAQQVDSDLGIVPAGRRPEQTQSTDETKQAQALSNEQSQTAESVRDSSGEQTLPVTHADEAKPIGLKKTKVVAKDSETYFEDGQALDEGSRSLEVIDKILRQPEKTPPVEHESDSQKANERVTNGIH